MLDTFIKNRGSTKTLIHDNNHNDFSKIDWDADYDGDVANVSLDLNTNGRNSHYDIQLDNNDLAKILNVPSVNLPLDKRLSRDFKKHSYRKTPYIEMDQEPLIPPSLEQYQLIQNKEPFYTHISSPLPNEELLIPLSVGKTRRRHKRHKSHKVYRRFNTNSGIKKSLRGRKYTRRTM
jgi:hypothetical protein